MSGSRVKFITCIAIVMSLIISGCVSEPPAEVSPTTTLTTTPVAAKMEAGVEVINAPDMAEVAHSFEINWMVNNPVETDTPHTAIHYGPESQSEPLTTTSYPDLTKPEKGTIPAEFSAALTINETGTTYFRAHAVIEGENYWSDEMTVTISEPAQEKAISTALSIKVTSYPGSVDGETDYTIKWEVSGGIPGDIGHTAIHWGFSSASADIANYPRVSQVLTGNTPQSFSTILKSPAGGSIFFRAHAIVDSTHVYSDEYKITIIAAKSGNGGGGY